MIAATEVFKALSDPVRVEMVYRLSQGQGSTLSTLSHNLGVTRQGARKHLTILEQADVVRLYKKGRNTEVRLNPQSLDVMKQFIALLEKQWDQRLLALRDFVENEETKA